MLTIATLTRRLTLRHHKVVELSHQITIFPLGGESSLDDNCTLEHVECRPFKTLPRTLTENVVIYETSTLRDNRGRNISVAMCVLQAKNNMLPFHNLRYLRCPFLFFLHIMIRHFVRVWPSHIRYLAFSINNILLPSILTFLFCKLFNIITKKLAYKTNKRRDRLL